MLKGLSKKGIQIRRYKSEYNFLTEVREMRVICSIILCSFKCHNRAHDCKHNRLNHTKTTHLNGRVDPLQSQLYIYKSECIGKDLS